MKQRADLQVQRPLDFAIVDEVDSILIDEARTPLIISGAAHDDAREVPQGRRRGPEDHRAEQAVGRGRRQGRRRRARIKAAEGDIDKCRATRTKTAMRDEMKRLQEAEQQLAEAERRSRTDAVLRGGDGTARASTSPTRASPRPRKRPASAVLRRQQHGVAAPDGAGPARPRGLRARQGLRRRARQRQMEVVIVDEFTGRQDGRPAVVRRAAPGGRGQGSASRSRRRRRRSPRSRSRTSSSSTSASRA